MNRKQTYINLLKDFDKKRTEALKRVEAIKNSNELNEQGKENKIIALKEEITRLGKSYALKLNEMIDKTIEAAETKGYEKIKKNFKDAGYQAGLTNLLLAIRSNALEYDEVVSIVDKCYKDDTIAIKLINSELINQNMPSVLYYDKSKTIRNLRNHKEGLIFIEEPNLEDDLVNNVIIDGMISYIEHNFNDDLMYNQF